MQCKWNHNESMQTVKMSLQRNVLFISFVFCCCCCCEFSSQRYLLGFSNDVLIFILLTFIIELDNKFYILIGVVYTVQCYTVKWHGVCKCRSVKSFWKSIFVGRLKLLRFILFTLFLAFIHIFALNTIWQLSYLSKQLKQLKTQLEITVEDCSIVLTIKA